MNSPRGRAATLTAIAVLAALAAGGCRQDMHDQPVIEPYEVSWVFADGKSALAPPAGTVARGDARQDRILYSGLEADGSLATELPVELSRALLERGRERYDIFCSPCHDRVGNGRGMVVRRGYKRPASFHDPRLRESPVGYFFTVVTNGFGEMPSYAALVGVEDRWAIAAYIRALQLSQGAALAELEPALAARFGQRLAAATETPAAPTPGGHGE